jgi:DNA-binding XRE family transcriptional regulator
MRRKRILKLSAKMKIPQCRPEIAKRFKAFRRKSGMTQERLGNIIGICRQTINEIENRRVYPRCSTIGRFVDLEKRHEEARRVTASLRSVSWNDLL